MTNYFHGQRVKLVKPRLPENMGNEGFFVRYENFPRGTLMSDGVRNYDDTDCVVLWDCRPALSAARTECIVPILPSGAGPCEAEFTIPITSTEKVKELVQ